jgi:hypothetical protein
MRKIYKHKSIKIFIKQKIFLNLVMKTASIQNDFRKISHILKIQILQKEIYISKNNKLMNKYKKVILMDSNYIRNCVKFTGKNK